MVACQRNVVVEGPHVGFQQTDLHSCLVRMDANSMNLTDLDGEFCLMAMMARNIWRWLSPIQAKTFPERQFTLHAVGKNQVESR